MFIILEEYKKTCTNAEGQIDAYVERSVRQMLDSCFAAMFVVCRADKPRDQEPLSGNLITGFRLVKRNATWMWK